MADIPKKVRDAVNDRAQGRCEGCGEIRPLELHHRKFRSRGGKHTVPNLVALCGWGNHTGCHGLAHSATPPEGWAIPSGVADPIHTPFRTADGRLLFLAADGRAVESTDPDF